MILQDVIVRMRKLAVRLSVSMIVIVVMMMVIMTMAMRMIMLMIPPMESFAAALAPIAP